MSINSIYLETSKPIKFCEIELVIDSLQLMGSVNINPKSYTIMTSNNITKTQIKYAGFIHGDEFEIIQKYILEKYPKLNIVNIYYRTSETNLTMKDKQ